MMLISLIGTLIKSIVFAFLPFQVYLIINRTAKFFFHTGIHKSTYSAMATAGLAGLGIGIAGIPSCISARGSDNWQLLAQLAVMEYCQLSNMELRQTDASASVSTLSAICTALGISLIDADGLR